MKNSPAYSSKETKELIKAILSLRDEAEANKFLRDLLTIPEIEDLTQRFQIAKLLYLGNSYAVTAEKVSASTTTVSRVAHWLFRGRGGYKHILTRLFPQKK